MSQYKVLQVRTNVKALIEKMSKDQGVSQSGLIAALIYTLDGRQDHGKVELNWNSVKLRYPAPPIKADQKKRKTRKASGK